MKKFCIFLLSSMLVGCLSSKDRATEASPAVDADGATKAEACVVETISSGVKITCGGTSAILNHGTNGVVGASGSNGTNGTNGVAGFTGASGAIGPTGAAGATGAQGPQGIQGPSGPVGPAGAGSGGALRLYDANGVALGDYVLNTLPYRVWDATNGMMIGYNEYDGKMSSAFGQSAYYLTADCSGNRYVLSEVNGGTVNLAFYSPVNAGMVFDNTLYRITSTMVQGIVLSSQESGSCAPLSVNHQLYNRTLYYQQLSAVTTTLPMQAARPFKLLWQ